MISLSTDKGDQMAKYSDKVIELAENGILSWEEIARECIAEMSEDDVEDMCATCDWPVAEGDSE
jgi:hypothetical protein